MFRELDVHGPSGTLAVCINQDDGSRKILIYDITTKRQIGEVSHTYIPEGPRFSPDGRHPSRPLALYKGSLTNVTWRP